MAAVLDRSRSKLPRPKTARVTDIQPPRSPRSPNRRHTIPGGNTHTAPTLSSRFTRPSDRIEKPTQPRKSLRYEPIWANQFDERLSEYKDKIRAEVDRSLDEVHAQQIDKVEELSKQFEERLSILQESEKPLHSSIASEVLQIAVTSPDSPEGQEQHIEVDLQDRVKAFKEFVSGKHRLIQDLINNWNKTQVQVIALAAEIVGPDKVTINKKKKFKEFPDLDKVLGQSKASYDEASDVFNEVLADISDFEQQMGQLTASIKLTMHQIQLAKIQQRKNAINRLKEATEELQEGD